MDELSLPVAPPVHDIFRSAHLNTKDWDWPPPGGLEYKIALWYVDILQPEWDLIGTVPSPNEVIEIIDNNTVRVETPYPAYGRNLHYRVYQSFLPGGTIYQFDDGVADRPYIDDEIYYRTPDSFALLSTLDRALNRLESLRGQARGLVAAANEDFPVFEGDDTIIFT
jgi:hypothetical protein